MKKEIAKNISINSLIDDFIDVVEQKARIHWRLKLV